MRERENEYLGMYVKMKIFQKSWITNRQIEKKKTRAETTYVQGGPLLVINEVITLRNGHGNG